MNLLSSRIIPAPERIQQLLRVTLLTIPPVHCILGLHECNEAQEVGQYCTLGCSGSSNTMFQMHMSYFFLKKDHRHPSVEIMNYSNSGKPLLAYHYCILSLANSLKVNGLAYSSLFAPRCCAQKPHTHERLALKQNCAFLSPTLCGTDASLARRLIWCKYWGIACTQLQRRLS